MTSVATNSYKHTHCFHPDSILPYLQISLSYAEVALNYTLELRSSIFASAFKHKALLYDSSELFEECSL